MCDRPYSIFKWRPGRGEPYRKTEVCQACARIKNLCQTCILDMQLGLPAQLRDAVLQHTDGIQDAASQKNKDYMVQQQLALLEESGEMMLGELENEKLLQLARTATQNREQPRVKLVKGIPQQQQQKDAKESTSSNNNNNKQQKRKVDEISGGNKQDQSTSDSLPLPPGVTDLQSLSSMNSMETVPDSMKAFLSHFPKADIQPMTESVQSADHTHNNNKTKTTTTKKAKFAPRPPAGPPPVSALGQKK
jgi:hypothetical protein